MKSITTIPISDNTPKEFDKRNDIFVYGENNSYPDEVRLILDGSVTAKSAVELMSSFIYGKGFDNNGFYLNNINDTPNSLLRRVSLDIPYYKGFVIHIGYNALGQKTSYKLIPLEWVRFGKEDVNGYKSKIKVSKDWSDKKEPVTTYDVYNPDAVLSQIENVDGVENYLGQVFYGSLDFKGIYPKSFSDPVLYDCISENQSGLFKKNLLTRGFLNNTVVVTKPFDDKKDKTDFQSNLKKQLGAKGLESLTHITADLDSDNLDSEIVFKELKSNVDDKLFEYTDKNVADKIRKSFLNIPPALIDASDNSLFGQSGESLKQMKLFYQEQTDYIRDFINESFNELFSNSTNSKFSAIDWNINPLIKEESNEITD